MKWNWGSSKKVCFLCASPDMKDHGYIEYSFRESNGERGHDKKEICALCCERVETSNVITRGDEDESV
jgi:hypothetical protein